MQEFAYIARDASGQRVDGTVTAATSRDVVNILTSKSLFPIEITDERPRQRVSRSRVKGQQMAVAYAQLASLLRSGVPLLRSIDVLRKQASNPTLAMVLGDIRDRVEQGEPMADAMSRFPRVFSDMAINMVRAGTEGGFLEEALERIAQFTEQQEDLKSQTVGALAYPVFLSVIGGTIVLCLIVFFVPKFGELFQQLRDKGQLPIMTEWLLTFSSTLQHWGLFILAGLAIVGVLIKARLATDRGRLMRDRVKLGLPLLGPIFENLAVARFCRVLGTLLRNGVPILRSLDISREAAGNRVLSGAIRQASENISAGESLAGPLGASGHFPVTVVEMISVAEESNTLDKVLVEIADGLEKRTSRRLELAVRLLEPILLLFLAGAVLCVVIALLMPIIKMSSTI